MSDRAFRRPVDEFENDPRLGGGTSRLGWSGVAATACLLGVPAIADAYPTYTVPAGVTPGEHYRLIFLTTDTTTASNSTIATYNTFVNTDAALNNTLPATTWDAVASTSTTSAITNVACSPSCASDPIFLVTGTKVANSTAGLFSGTLLTAINVTETDTIGPGTNQYNAYVWTGSNADGSVNASPLGVSDPEFGDYAATSSLAFVDGSYVFNTSLFSLYAISGDLVAPTGTPAPGGIALYGLGGLLTLAARKFRRARPASA